MVLGSGAGLGSRAAEEARCLPSPTLGVVHVGAILFDLHIPESRSLKAQRAAVKPIVEGLRRRFSVAVAEVGHLEQWQRAAVGAAAVGGTEGQVRDILDEVERFVWSRPDIQVLSSDRSWVEGEA